MTILCDTEREIIQHDIKLMLSIARIQNRIIELLNEQCDDSPDDFKHYLANEDYKSIMLMFEHSIIRFELDWIVNLMVMYCNEEYRASLFTAKFNSNSAIFEFVENKLSESYIEMIKAIYK